jgi:hypothetical protein
MTCWPLETLVYAEYRALTEYGAGAHPTVDLARDSWLRLRMHTPPEAVAKNLSRMRALLPHRDGVTEGRVQLALCFQLLRRARRLAPSLRQSDADLLTGHLLSNLSVFLRHAMEDEWMDVLSFVDPDAAVRRVSLRKSYFVDTSGPPTTTMTTTTTTTVYFYCNDGGDTPFGSCRYPGDVRARERAVLRGSRYVPSSGRGIQILAPALPLLHPARLGSAREAGTGGSSAGSRSSTSATSSELLERPPTQRSHLLPSVTFRQEVGGDRGPNDDATKSAGPTRVGDGPVLIDLTEERSFGEGG